MKTISITILLVLFYSISFGQIDTTKDFAHWNQELKAGQITIRDLKTLKISDLDLLKMDSMMKHKGFRIMETKFPHNIFKATIQEFSIKPLFDKKDILIYGLQFISGAADGMNQALVYHHALAGHPFWDYSTSWTRKYKNYPTDQRARFPGAKTWAVGITDGNHLTRMINRSFSLGSVMIAMSEGERWSEIIKEIIISSLINRIGFTIMYDHVLK